jgi:hypothetical protein
MAIELDDLAKLKCPLCGKLLTSNEYGYATEELKARVAEEYKQQSQKDRKDLEQQNQEQRDEHEAEIEELKKSHNEKCRDISEELKSWYKEQIESIKKSYDELTMRREKDLKDSQEEKTADYEQQLYTKDKQLQKLQNSLTAFEVRAIEKAEALVQNEIAERDTQINRLKEKVDELGKQLTKTQSELRGDTGEANLLKKLEDAFRKYNGVFTTQKKGVSGADIIHQIRTTSGELLETKIGYDNKEAAAIQARDIDKAKIDKKALGTDYFIIVSKNLPKEIKNGKCGEKEGILLANPDIVVELAKIIRKAIVQISKQFLCQQDVQTKQVKIYDLIQSREFQRHIEAINEVPKKLSDLQNKEKKDHETLWKKEYAIFEELRNTFNDITTGIDAILDEDQTRNQSEEQTENVEQKAVGDGKDEENHSPD